MSGPERPSDSHPETPPEDERSPEDIEMSQGQPTRYAPTDFLSHHEGVEGHGDQRDRHIREVSAELNRRSDFIQDLKDHAEKHRNRVPPPDGAGRPG
jgi:hypothetical protein